MVAYGEAPAGGASPAELQRAAGGLGADVLFVRTAPSEEARAAPLPAVLRGGPQRRRDSDGGGHAKSAGRATAPLPTLVSLGRDDEGADQHPIYARIRALNRTALLVERVDAADGRVTDSVTVVSAAAVSPRHKSK